MASHCYEDSVVLLNPNSGRRDGIKKGQKIKNVDQYGKCNIHRGSWKRILLPSV